MSRITAAVVCLLLALTNLAYGHSINLVAKATFNSPDSVTIHLLDLYANPAADAQVTIRAAAPGQPPGRQVTLSEGPPGTYKGQIRTDGSADVEILVDAVLNGELFQANFRFNAGEGGGEITRAMIPVDLPPQGFRWSLLLYGAAVALLAVVTLVALRRRPKPDQP